MLNISNSLLPFYLSHAHDIQYRYTSGYTQSASIFKGRLAAIRKACSSNVSFTYLEPPHIVHSVNLPDGSLVQYDSTANADNEEEKPRAWWFAKEIPGEKDKKKYEGMEETWKLLKETLEKEPFDIVLGFSQGESGYERDRYQPCSCH